MVQPGGLNHRKDGVPRKPWVSARWFRYRKNCVPKALVVQPGGLGAGKMARWFLLWFSRVV